MYLTVLLPNLKCTYDLINLIKNKLELFIDVVPDEVIWTVNLLHYLNYEAIPRISSTRRWFVLGTS